MGLAKLAEKVGIGAKHLGRVERGEKVPSFELIIALANAMGVSPAEFFDFDNVKVDQKAIKERLRQLLDKRDLDQLMRAYRVLRASLGP
jgi:transcriptional regulator with XRE-family HTH domain